MKLMCQRTTTKPGFKHVPSFYIEYRRGYACVRFLNLHAICLWMNCICLGEFVFAAPLWLSRHTAPLIRHQLGWAHPSCLWALLPVYLKQEEEGEYNQGSSLLYIRLRRTLRLFYGGGQQFCCFVCLQDSMIFQKYTDNWKSFLPQNEEFAVRCSASLCWFLFMLKHLE